MSRKYISVVRCRQHNLKEISCLLSHGKLTVFTGPSGSGKTSLAQDTLFAEAERRFLQCLSPKGRQWHGMLPAPDVDKVEGLSPSISVSQNRNSTNAQYTVARQCDIYDHLTLLFSKMGQQISPTTGKVLKRYSKEEIVDAILQTVPRGEKLQIYASSDASSDSLRKMGFVRVQLEGRTVHLDDEEPEEECFQVVIDRIVIKEGIFQRLTSSVETALKLGEGCMQVQVGSGGPISTFSEDFLCEDTGLRIPPIERQELNPLSPRGMCSTCKGRGGREVLDEKALIWEGEMSFELYLDLLPPKKRPGASLGKEALISIIREDLEEGKSRFSQQPFVQWEVCPDCQGSCLGEKARFCRFEGKTIGELHYMTVDNLRRELKNWPPNPISKELTSELDLRLQFLQRVGLGYLNLDRLTSSLSEGEAQRVQLAAQLGAKLTGVLYILDEPSRGLHPSDVYLLRSVIEELRDGGNSIILVEHNAILMGAADDVVEFGPGAGRLGGEITFQGSYANWLKTPSSRFLLSEPRGRGEALEHLKLEEVSKHNIHKLSIDIPKERLVGICGVSGSGKSTLVFDILCAKLRFERKKFLAIDQKKRAGSSRAIPATYVGLMTPLRKLYAETRLAKARGMGASYFSLNKKGGRCEACRGLGVKTLSMDFLADVELECTICDGKRYGKDALEISWQGKSLADVLDGTVQEALEHFQAVSQLASRLELLSRMGLGYLSLGQPFKTLSGGEVQRLKLVSELAKRTKEATIYVLDEPCSGLHFGDVRILLGVLQELVDAGHTVIVVEHNLQLLSECDHLIEMGPGSGPSGGSVIYEGPPTELTNTPTALALKEFP